MRAHSAAAMMCSIFESLAYNIRETDDLLNPVGAACLTGTIYKVTAVRARALPRRAGMCLRPPAPPSPRLPSRPSTIPLAPLQGPRVALSAGLGFGAFAAAGAFVSKHLSSRGLLKNFM